VFEKLLGGTKQNLDTCMVLLCFGEGMIMIMVGVTDESFCVRLTRPVI
jgi:hypothetical protein